jgi:malate permease and related proteins
LNELFSLFLNNLLPIFLAAGAGYLLSRYLGVNSRPISQLSFYIFSPCLVFLLITRNELDNTDILQMMFYPAVLVFLVGTVTYLVGRMIKLERRLLMASVLAAMLMNAGNYGLPVNLFAFGEQALAYASLYFVMMSIITYTVGVVIASMGSYGLKESMAGLIKIPAIYAVLLAFLFSNLDLTLPMPVDRTVTLLGNAAVPSMLVILGMQLQKVEWNGYPRALALAGGMRMLVAPLIATGISLVFGISGPARQAYILESAMPTAVFTTILATEFDLEPAFITTVVLMTTLISPLTLTPLLAFLGG